MNPLELRTPVSNLLCGRLVVAGGYGSISSVDRLPPTPGDPVVQLRVTAPDPSGNDRVYTISIKED